MILSNISVEIILSLVSIFLSLATMTGSAYVFWRYDKRINKQNILINEFTLREQKEKEEDSKKANIEVSYLYGGKGNGDLFVVNSGNSEARNLRMEIDEREDSGIHWRVGSIFPYNCLTPGASITIHYGLLSGYQKDPVLKFYWEDDYGRDRSVKHSVFLG